MDELERNLRKLKEATSVNISGQELAQMTDKLQLTIDADKPISEVPPPEKVEKFDISSLLQDLLNNIS